MDKQHIVNEIKRTASDNGGAPLGVRLFWATTGIREADWKGKYWARWGDAIEEAGLKPNKLVDAYRERDLLEILGKLIQKLGHYPTPAELKLMRKSDPNIPDYGTFRKRGSKEVWANKLIEYYRDRSGWEDVVSTCENLQKPHSKPADINMEEELVGEVYLIRMGKYHKIGKSNSVGRRQYELAIQLPERAIFVHSLKTDDPTGIEQYWHKRFADKRKNGESFELNAKDISAFKRRKSFM